ncbi:PapB family radical SAM/SPASM ranthipeptide maturase [Streptomyces agglomeratus]|uniref:PapB family radical SAM/SPASM ranthipeptide maturase n=1 Tax=Streptomyces agglomeratus TaxID=285458 RepID=UPI000854D830|nr:radical SAM protein [Streptomyces agglomeratus]
MTEAVSQARIDIPLGFSRPNLTGLSLQVTDACNLACSYCYFYKKDPVALTHEIIDRSLDLLDRECGESSADWHVNLFGGEPTLRPDLIRYICSNVRSRAESRGKNVSFSMTTNGTRFDQRLLDLTTEFEISTMLSLDGNQKAHDKFRQYQDGRGSFDQIVAHLEWLKAAPHFKVRLTISPLTVEFLAESLEDLVELGITNIATSQVMEQEWSPEHLTTFAEQWQRVGALYIRERLKGNTLTIKGLKGRETQEPLEVCKAPSQFGCGAATTFVFVNCFGDLYPCHRYPGYFDKSPHVRLGSVFTGIDEVKRLHYVMANLASSKKGCHSFVSSTQSKGACGGCAIQGACGGSCMAVNEYVTGDPTQPPSVPGAIEQIKLSVLQQVHEYLAEVPRPTNPTSSS